MTTPTSVGGRHYIHFNPDRTDFAVTSEELARLQDAGSNLWKDLCLVCLPLGIACTINAIAATPKPFALSLALFLNYVIGGICILLGVAFGIAWYRNHTSFTTIVNEIKCKPKMQLNLPTVVDVGALPTATMSPAPTPTAPKAHP